MKEIGITEHGFGHVFFGVRKRNIKKMRAEIERLQKIYPIKIYLGIEANLISSDGDIDLTKQEQEWFDYIIMGYHELVWPKTFKDYKFFRKNLKAYKNNSYTQEIIKNNTQAYINALQKNKIDIISHIGSKMKVDIVEVAKMCRQTDTYLEINGRRICYQEDEIKSLVDMGTKFIINSDAHIAKNVGECNYPTNFAIKNNIPLSLIANIDKLPKFKK